jgi:hypothetical protein
MSARFSVADFKNRRESGRFVAGSPWDAMQYTTVPIEGLQALIELVEKAHEVVASYRSGDEVRWSDFCDAVDAFTLAPRTAGYTKEIQHGDVMTREQWLNDVRNHFFLDYDGFGYAMKDGKTDPTTPIYPSGAERLPEDATHVVWFNK